MEAAGNRNKNLAGRDYKRADVSRIKCILARTSRTRILTSVMIEENRFRLSRRAESVETGRMVCPLRVTEVRGAVSTDEGVERVG